MSLRECKKCGKEALSEEDLDLFVFNTQSKHNRENRCKACRDSATKNWDKENKEARKNIKKKWVENNKTYHKEYNLKANYNLDLKDYMQMLEDQDYKCCICKTELTSKNTHTDHNHKTGEVRGLLCQTCNQGLGLFKDNPLFLTEAAAYLLEKGDYR